MGKPIAGLNQFPFNHEGYLVTAAVLEDGTKLHNLCIIKQRSMNLFDLSDGTNVYKYMKITGLDKNGHILKKESTKDELAELLKNGTFCVKGYDKNMEVTGYIIKFLFNKISIYNSSPEYNNEIRAKIKDITLDKHTDDVYDGSTDTLTFKLDPKSFEGEYKVKWVSSNDSYATVDQTGKVTFSKDVVGDVAITVTVSYEGDEFSDTCTYTINFEPITSIKMNPNDDSFTVDYKHESKWDINVVPSHLKNERIVITNNDPSIATIDINGNVKGLKIGKTDITISDKKDPTNSISKVINTIGTVQSISITGLNQEYNIGDEVSLSLQHTMPEEDVDFYTYEWSTDNEGIIFDNNVGKTIKGTAVKSGTCIVTATVKEMPEKTNSKTTNILELIKSVIVKEGIPSNNYKSTTGEYELIKGMVITSSNDDYIGSPTIELISNSGDLDISDDNLRLELDTTIPEENTYNLSTYGVKNKIAETNVIKFKYKIKADGFDDSEELEAKSDIYTKPNEYILSTMEYNLSSKLLKFKVYDNTLKKHTDIPFLNTFRFKTDNLLVNNPITNTSNEYKLQANSHSFGDYSLTSDITKPFYGTIADPEWTIVTTNSEYVFHEDTNINQIKFVGNIDNKIIDFNTAKINDVDEVIGFSTGWYLSSSGYNKEDGTFSIMLGGTLPNMKEYTIKATISIGENKVIYPITITGTTDYDDTDDNTILSSTHPSLQFLEDSGGVIKNVTITGDTYSLPTKLNTGIKVTTDGYSDNYVKFVLDSGVITENETVTALIPIKILTTANTTISSSMNTTFNLRK